MKKLLVVAALLLAGCAGYAKGHLTCYKLNGDVMYDADVRSAYVSDGGMWRVTDTDGETVAVTGDCVYYSDVRP